MRTQRTETKTNTIRRPAVAGRSPARPAPSGLVGRTAAALAFSLVLAAGIGCGGGGKKGGGTPPPTQNPIVAAFAASGTASAPNGVRLTGAGAGDSVQVNVVLAGQTTSTDLYSFAFDLVLGDPTVARYVANSAALGTALTFAAGQQGQVFAVQNGARVTVGVTKLGGGAGNGVGAGEETVVSLMFQLLKRRSTTLTIEGSPPNPAAALDSGGTIVPSVAFDRAGAALSGT